MDQTEELRGVEDIKLGNWHHDLIQLLENCEHFELRVSILERNCNEKIRELYKMSKNLGNEDKTLLEGKMVTLLDNVKKFDKNREKDVSNLENEIKILKNQIKERALESDIKFLKDRIELLAHPPVSIPNKTPQTLTPLPRQPITVTPYSGSLLDPQIFHRKVGDYSYQLSGYPPPAVPYQQHYAGIPLQQGVPIVPIPTLPQLSQPVSVPHSLASTVATHIDAVSAYDGGVPDIVPEEKYSLLVGTEGKTIDAIRQLSGAQISIKEKRDKPPNLYYEVHYYGDPGSVKYAREMVSNIVNPLKSDNNSEKTKKHKQKGKEKGK